MEAQPVDELSRQGWFREPKYDGFRCLAFRIGEQVDWQSKKSLKRLFFPEVAAAEQSGNFLRGWSLPLTSLQAFVLRLPTKPGDTAVGTRPRPSLVPLDDPVVVRENFHMRRS